ncbi:carbohydrate kinase family protein [Paenibacillus sp. KQZ6P-2]|uniref:Carbohydrate kinase family protein n=1 Tax=Paenibacillus mangrovi TaxID=2931978 RepID=A0A9X1WTM4_9BACL|nr:carbohydrate kinase family protein [Paenibacillus mangrovi]MCJ8013690.1 carbohydrate kinase family protein [Paenibacillus mangrovi]
MRALQSPAADIVIAGHICLDVIPAIHGHKHGSGLGELLVPGKLVEIGPAVLSTGGAVSNTGLALHRLGFPVKLMGKIGDDPFGGLIMGILKGHGEALARDMIVARGESSSYSIVISPPSVDRVFLHCTGANDTFASEDVTAESLQSAKLFHFGYPPLMRRMFADGGTELERLLYKVKAQGLTVSLDLARPDPDSPAGQVDWPAILARVLPYVDVFLPSFEEIVYMLRPEVYRELSEQHGTTDMIAYADGPLLSSLSEQLLNMGAAMIGLKLGEYGFYLRTASSRERLAAMGACTPDEERLTDWQDRELLAPCFQVEVVGTTGAGDCTIAGFLGGLWKRSTIEEVLLGAVGVGACNVERADAVSGIRSWAEVQARMAAGWNRSEAALLLPGWTYESKPGIWELRR